MVSSNHVINPSIYARLPFDPIEDVTPISVLGESPMVLLVNPSVPATNLQQLLALLKAKPDAYNYASSGNGSIYHLATELMLDQAGVKAKHIPYRGTAPQLTAVVSGEVHFAIAGMSSSVAHMKSGAVRAIGVCGAARVPAEASLPNLAEQGLTDYSMEAWFAIIGPAKMPAAVVRHINEGVVAAYRRQDVVDAISKKGGVLKPGTSQDAAAFFRSERRRYAEIAKRANITLT
jgi:tripartite-type tricarboxylate transporter receptor subunit TctC